MNFSSSNRGIDALSFAVAFVDASTHRILGYNKPFFRRFSVVKRPEPFEDENDFEPEIQFLDDVSGVSGDDPFGADFGGGFSLNAELSGENAEEYSDDGDFDKFDFAQTERLDWKSVVPSTADQERSRRADDESADLESDESLDAPDMLERFIGRDFYRTIGFPYIVDGDFCPFLTAKIKNRPTRSVFSDDPNLANGVVFQRDLDDDRGERFEMFVSPRVFDSQRVLLIEIKRIPGSSKTERILKTLQQAGGRLTALDLDDLALSETQRVELLRARVAEDMRYLLNYSVVEIRLLNPQTRELIPLLSLGLDPDAKERRLFAFGEGNGITGYVAASGEPYICDDVKNDFLYRPGAIEAASSLTVPIAYRDRVVGVCNVESARPNAFTKQDVAFLQLYAKNLGVAIQTLDLISSENNQSRRQCGFELRDELAEPLATTLESAANLAGLVDDLAKSVDDLNASEKAKFSVNEILQSARELTRRCGSLKKQAARVRQTFCSDVAPRNGAVESATARSKEFDDFRGKRVLFVERDAGFVATAVEQLEPLGVEADVVSGSRSAVDMFRIFEYDAVVSEVCPDGSYLTADDAPTVLNPYGLSLVDLHLPGYFEPSSDERDSEKRREIFELVQSGRKLDAFFLRRKLESDRQNARDAESRRPIPPFIIVQTDYDPTHVARELRTRPLFKEGDFRKSLLTALKKAFATPAQS